MGYVLQTLTVSNAHGPLPSSTGQITDQATADQIIATNRRNAASQGLTLNADGSITDPVSGITILQGYVDADPRYDTPAHPMCGGTPTTPAVKPIDAIGVGTLKIFSWGQSHACNCGRGRYTSRNALTWAWSAGNSYPLTDPVVGPDGTDGSIWPRFADLVMGQPFNGTAVNRVIIGSCARGSTSISQWTQAGNLNSLLTGELTAFIVACGQPTYLHFCQGPADVLDMTTAQWFAAFQAMLTTVRGTGCTSPIYVDVDTLCNMRDAANPPPNEPVSRSAQTLIQYEVGRQNIRAAQAQAASINANTRLGANYDSISWELRALGDGCHLGDLGLMQHAQLLVSAMFPPATTTQRAATASTDQTT